MKAEMTDQKYPIRKFRLENICITSSSTLNSLRTILIFETVLHSLFLSVFTSEE